MFNRVVLFTGIVMFTGAVTFGVVVTLTGTVLFAGTVFFNGTVSFSGTVLLIGTVLFSGTVLLTGTVVFTGMVAFVVTLTGTVLFSGTVLLTGTVALPGIVAFVVTLTGTVVLTGMVLLIGTVLLAGIVTFTGMVVLPGRVVFLVGSGSSFFGNLYVSRPPVHRTHGLQPPVKGMSIVIKLMYSPRMSSCRRLTKSRDHETPLGQVSVLGSLSVTGISMPGCSSDFDSSVSDVVMCALPESSSEGAKRTPAFLSNLASENC